MKLNLGQLRCIYCESENLRCCEWYPGLKEEDPEDWYLEQEVPDYAQDNFSTSNEIILLVNCERCQQWFKFEAEAKQIGTSNLKISKEAGDLGSAILEFDPVEQVPKAIIIKSFRFKVFSYSVTSSTPNFSRSGMGYFYPYPKRMFEKFWANIIRYSTNEVHLRGLTKKQVFQTHGGGFCLCSRDF